MEKDALYRVTIRISPAHYKYMRIGQYEMRMSLSEFIRFLLDKDLAELEVTDLIEDDPINHPRTMAIKPLLKVTQYEQIVNHFGKRSITKVISTLLDREGKKIYFISKKKRNSII